MGSSVGVSSVAELNVGKRRLESFLRRKRRALALLLVAVLAGTAAWAIGIVVPAEAKTAVTLDQCANLGTICDIAHPEQWQHGNLNVNNSLYFEGDSVAYRAVMTGLTVGATYAVTIEWDTTQSGKHAIDYLTSFDRSVPGANPCGDVACGSPATLAIPVDPNVAAAGVTEVSNRVFTAYGATFPAPGAAVINSGDLCGDSTCTIGSNPTPHTVTGTYAGNSQTTMTLYLTAGMDSVVLAWGGHIAERRDWGAGKSAVALSGSPYHMRLIGLACSDTSNCSAGNQDRSLSSEAVIYGASITVVKDASVEGDAAYLFTASPAPLSGFSLTDDGTSANTKAFTGIVDFGEYTVNEQAGNNFRLASVDCTTTSPNGGSSTPAGSGVTIDLREGESVVCTFRNTVDGSKSINLTKTADPTTYDSVGDIVIYSYTITNDGDVVLGPTQFTITDNRINGGLPFACGAADQILAIGSSLTCTAAYKTTVADVNDELVTNVATGSGGGATTPVRTATVTLIAVPPTSTTVAPTTSTTSAPTTTAGPTTTVVANVVTTTVAISTTAPPTSTSTVPATVSPTTTSKSEFQALLQPTTTTPARSDFLVLYPDELPKTGSRFNLGFLVAALALLAVGALVGFLNVRVPRSSTKERNN